MKDIENLVTRIEQVARQKQRCLVAISGPPGAGKSTLARQLVQSLNLGATPERAILVPLDGFHFDNAVLDANGTRGLKGAPETFDAWGFINTIQRIANREPAVGAPIFDRAADLARAGAIVVDQRHKIVLVEGNYLLLAKDPWARLAGIFDLKIAIEVSPARLAARLTRRWHGLGLDDDKIKTRVENHDLINARLVRDFSSPPDIRFQNG